MSETKVFICGTDTRPGPRDEGCSNTLHDYPLPRGYNAAHEVAGHRLRKGWSSRKCPDCKLYGWSPGLHTCEGCAV